MCEGELGSLSHKNHLVAVTVYLKFSVNFSCICCCSGLVCCEV